LRLAGLANSGGFWKQTKVRAVFPLFPNLDNY